MESKRADVEHRTTKLVSKEELLPGQRANTGGDHYDRSRNNYSKQAPHKADDEPLYGF